MQTGFKSACIPAYRLLTEDQIEEIHQATLDLLRKTGVKVLNAEALELLQDAGCRVMDQHIVKIPDRLVEESIRSAPSSVTLYNRNAEPISPLVHSCGAVDKLLMCADNGVPLNYSPALLSGGSGPVTLAGAVVVANAEALSGFVIQQLRVKGAPAITGFSATPMDMRTGTTVYASPDERLTHSACCDLYHYYGLPVWGEAGCSDAGSLDEQAAMEAMASIMMATLDGCNLVHDVGYLGQGLAGSAAAVVMCSEIISYVRRIRRGFDISRDRIGLDVIHEVGPGGNFLAHGHTLAYCREEHWVPRFANRRSPEVWQEKGGKRYGSVVVEKALDILATHQPERLSPASIKRLDAILEKASDRLSAKRICV